MTQTLGFIGSGNIGSALARLAVAAGLDVVLSNSRGPETLADLVADLGEHARPLGYDAVDIGTLAESWRSEPGTSAYVQPYLPVRPAEEMSPEEAMRWFLGTPGLPVPADRVKELVDATVRASAGSARATLARD